MIETPSSGSPALWAGSFTRLHVAFRPVPVPSEDPDSVEDGIRLCLLINSTVWTKKGRTISLAYCLGEGPIPKESTIDPL